MTENNNSDGNLCAYKLTVIGIHVIGTKSKITMKVSQTVTRVPGCGVKTVMWFHAAHACNNIILGYQENIDGFVQNSGNSIANALELLQSCTVPLI